jgi:sulfate transport system ATP-binding protein
MTHDADTTAPFIAIRGLTRRFGGFTALDDVSLDVPGGGLVALLGPSGSGKTTLLRILAGLDHADHGTVALDGLDLASQPARQRNVGLVFQHYALFRHLDVPSCAAGCAGCTTRSSSPRCRGQRDRGCAGRGVSVR